MQKPALLFPFSQGKGKENQRKAARQAGREERREGGRTRGVVEREQYLQQHGKEENPENK